MLGADMGMVDFEFCGLWFPRDGFLGFLELDCWRSGYNRQALGFFAMLALIVVGEEAISVGYGVLRFHPVCQEDIKIQSIGEGVVKVEIEAGHCSREEFPVADGGGQSGDGDAVNGEGCWGLVSKQGGQMSGPKGSHNASDDSAWIMGSISKMKSGGGCCVTPVNSCYPCGPMCAEIGTYQAD